MLTKLVRLIKICLNDSYSRVCIGKNLMHFPFTMVLKKGDALSPLLFNFALCSHEGPKNQEGPHLNITYQFLFCADDVNIPCENINTRAILKVRGLALLLRVGTLCRCDDGLFFEVPRSSLFMVEKAQKSHGVRSGLYGECSNGVPPIHFFQTEHRIQFRSRPMRYLGFSNHEKGDTRQEILK
jgi:hypothetical protein